jgi:hypothetical protein
MITLCITVEILFPQYIYKEKYSRFAIMLFILVLFIGSMIILSQLKLAGSSVFSYRENTPKYQEHFLLQGARIKEKFDAEPEETMYSEWVYVNTVTKTTVNHLIINARKNEKNDRRGYRSVLFRFDAALLFHV